MEGLRVMGPERVVHWTGKLKVEAPLSVRVTERGQVREVPAAT